jgi:hypothetical protein
LGLISAPYNRKDDIMKVTRNHSKETFLSSLDYGDVFELDDMIYMLINDNEPHQNMLPCVKLHTGELIYISEDIFVIPHYTAELKY